MYGSILSATKQFLTPDMIAKMATASGVLDPAAAERLVGGAVPSILSALANLVAKPGGARQLGDAIAEQSPRTLENFATTIGSSTSGRSIRPDLLSGSAFSALASAIDKFAASATAPPLSARHARPSLCWASSARARAGGHRCERVGADARGHREDRSAAAVPEGLSQVLESNGCSTAWPCATTHEARPCAAAGASAQRTHATKAAPPPLLGPAHLDLPFLAFGAASDLFRLRQPRTAAAATPLVPSPRREASGGGVDVQQQVASNDHPLQTTLQEVKDSASAVASLPSSSQRPTSWTGSNSSLRSCRTWAPGACAARQGNDHEAQRQARRRRRHAGGARRSSGLPSRACAQDRYAGHGEEHAAQQLPRRDRPEGDLYCRSPSDAVLVSVYFNRSVYNQDGERLGSITISSSTADGSVVAAVIGVGGFLGIGEKEIAVPFAIARVARRDNTWHLVIDANKDALQSAPSFEAVGERVRLIVPRQ